jgi:hypothetical protein
MDWNDRGALEHTSATVQRPPPGKRLLPYGAIQTVDARILWTVLHRDRLASVILSCSALRSSFAKNQEVVATLTSAATPETSSTMTTLGVP